MSDSNQNTTPAAGDNLPSIVALFDKLHRHAGEIEGIGRDIVIDLFDNRAGNNLDLLALGNATTTAADARKVWLLNTLPHYKSNTEKLEKLSAAKNKPAATDLVAFSVWHGEVEALKIEQEADRAMINRAVPAAFYLSSRNAGVVTITGKGKKVLLTFECDSADTAIHAPVIDTGTGKPVPVLRSTKAMTLTGLEKEGADAITAHRAKLADSGTAVKANAPRGKRGGKGKGKASDPVVKLEGEKAILATAATLSQGIADTTGEALIKVASATETEMLICNVVAARFGKRNKLGKLVTVDIGEVFKWLKLQTFFDGVQFTGHAFTAEIVKDKPAAPAVKAAPAVTAPAVKKAARK